MAFSKIDILARSSDLALAAAAPGIKQPDAKVTPKKPAKKPSRLSTETRFGRLDGKPPSRPRGRHAVARSDTSDEDDDDVREVITIPVNQRLGFRVAEFAALIGVSHVTIWRGIKAGRIDVIDQNGIKIIPRAFAIKTGLITADDTV